MPPTLACIRAFQTRDPAYDGAFFIAVRTTGIYCRPVCPVKQPLLRNVTFLPTAAAAERAGYRPCLRCRPETAPFCPAWQGTRCTVARALRLIEGGALNTASVPSLADRLGITPRHLTRLFAAQLGASLAQIARTGRLHHAKRLLDETALPIAAIAHQAGFPSPRRMTAAFTALYGRPPSTLRTRKPPPAKPAPLPETEHAAHPH